MYKVKLPITKSCAAWLCLKLRFENVTNYFVSTFHKYAIEGKEFGITFKKAIQRI